MPVDLRSSRHITSKLPSKLQHALVSGLGHLLAYGDDQDTMRVYDLKAWVRLAPWETLEVI